MKRIILIAILVLGCFSAKAQNAITYHGGSFYDAQGQCLSDNQVFDLIGSDVYYDTYVGARKQLKIGKELTFSGIGVVGAGCIAAFFGGYYGSDVLASCGVLAATAGGALIDAGVPLWIIGKSRLQWIESDYNKRQSAYTPTLSFKAGEYGLGFALTF